MEQDGVYFVSDSTIKNEDADKNVVEEVFSFNSDKSDSKLKEQKLNEVSSPKYYSRFSPQTIQCMQDVLTPEEFQGFCRGNIMKYCERMRHKDNPINESAKIIKYAELLNQSLKGEKVSV